MKSRCEVIVTSYACNKNPDDETKKKQAKVNDRLSYRFAANLLQKTASGSIIQNGQNKTQ